MRAMPWEPAELERAIGDFLDVRDVAVLAGRIKVTPRRRTARFETIAAERELVRVHRRETARLMREAAELRLARGTWDPRLASAASCAHAPGGTDTVALDRWRAAAVRGILSALKDGLAALEVADFLPWLLRDPSAWPSALQLVDASLLAEDCEEGRLLLARAQLVLGHRREATEVLSQAFRRGVSTANRWRWFSNLAVAHEDSGGDRLALGALTFATSDPECGVAPRVSALFLAMAIGDCARARHAARVLAATPPDDPDLRASCSHRLLYLRRRGESAPWSPPFRDARRLFDGWCRSDGQAARATGSAAGTVCRALARGEA